MVELGVFLPVGKNGYIVLSDAHGQAASQRGARECESRRSAVTTSIKVGPGILLYFSSGCSARWFYTGSSRRRKYAPHGSKRG